MDFEKNNKYYEKLSRSLSWLLRHHVVDKGLMITTDGYVLLDDIFKMNEFKNYTFDDINHVVENNDKKRFDLKSIECPNNKNNKIWYIRANQGHSHQVATKIKQDELLTKLTEPLDLIVHGTTFEAYKVIKNTGLKKMDRSHIHFAITDDIVKGNSGQSGIRGNCQILIYVDMKKAMDDGINFYISKNKVVLSEGKDDQGIDIKYFSKVIDRKTKKNILLNE